MLLWATETRRKDHSKIWLVKKIFKNKCITNIYSQNIERLCELVGRTKYLQFQSIISWFVLKTELCSIILCSINIKDKYCLRKTNPLLFWYNVLHLKGSPQAQLWNSYSCCEVHIHTSIVVPFIIDAKWWICLKPFGNGLFGFWGRFLFTLCRLGERCLQSYDSMTTKMDHTCGVCTYSPPSLPLFAQVAPAYQ